VTQDVNHLLTVLFLHVPIAVMKVNSNCEEPMNQATSSQSSPQTCEEMPTKVDSSEQVMFIHFDCHCQSKFFSVARISELLQTPWKCSRVTELCWGRIVKKVMFLNVGEKRAETGMIGCPEELAAV